jgi:hypothetical protein
MADFIKEIGHIFCAPQALRSAKYFCLHFRISNDPPQEKPSENGIYVSEGFLLARQKIGIYWGGQVLRECLFSVQALD